MLVPERYWWKPLHRYERSWVVVVFALLLALNRWQAIHLLPADWFYRILTAHGVDMQVAWIVFFAIAGLYFGSNIMLNAPLKWPRVGWLAFALKMLFSDRLWGSRWLAGAPTALSAARAGPFAGGLTGPSRPRPACAW